MSSENGSANPAPSRAEKDRAWLTEWAANPFRRASTIAIAAETTKGSPSAPCRRRIVAALTAAVEAAESGEPDRWVDSFLEALDKPAVELVLAPTPALPAAPPPPPRVMPTGPVTRETVISGYEDLKAGWAYLREQAERMIQNPEPHIQAQGNEMLGSVLDKERTILREMARSVGADKAQATEKQVFPAYIGPYRCTSVKELVEKQGWTHDGADIFDIEDSPTAPSQE